MIRELVRYSWPRTLATMVEALLALYMLAVWWRLIVLLNQEGPRNEPEGAAAGLRTDRPVEVKA